MILLPKAISLATIARQIASDIYDLSDVAKRNELSMDQLGKIIDTPEFQKILDGMIKDWNAAGTTPERIKVRAGAAVEAALDVFYNDMTDHAIPLAQRVEALKAMMKLGELGEKDALGGGALGGVTINIDLGSAGEGRPPEMITINAAPIADLDVPAQVLDASM